MAVREYIGARYIPIFSDPIEWDSTLSYEPLTVVKNQGSSYVSKQYVPEGVQITNENYWILWADFNAQLEQYRNEVRQFDGRITANANAISAETTARENADNTLQDNIDAEETARINADTNLNSAITTERSERVAAINATNALLPSTAFTSTNTVKKAIDAVEAQMQAIETSIATSTIKNECILMLGDSYAQGEHAESSTSHNGPNWQDYMTNTLGFTDVYKYKAGSAGFIATSTSTGGSASTVPTGTTYNEVLNYAYEYINGLGRANEVKHILIQGGVNDASRLLNGSTTETAISTAISTCVANLRSKFPNAKIYIVYVSCGSTSWQKSPVRMHSIPSIYNAGAMYGGVVYGQCTNLPWCYSTATVTHDGSHPTSAMQRYIAGYMSRLLMGDDKDYSATFSVSGGDFGGSLVGCVTTDHRLIFPLTRTINVSYNGGAVPFNDGTILQPVLIPADSRLEVSNNNYTAPMAYYNQNASFIGQFSLTADGRIKWLQRDQGATSTSKDSMTALNCFFDFPIG